jgi:hypothetical protein
MWRPWRIRNAALPDAFAVMARVYRVAGACARVIFVCASVRSSAPRAPPSSAASATRIRTSAGWSRITCAADAQATSFAEIVHLPEGRIGNILLRPSVREYEIEFLGECGAPAARRIPITDLLVSLRGDTLVVRSSRLNRRIIPRLTAAHNYSLRSLGLYQFLCALQSDGRSSRASWSWGSLDSAPFLPRVTHGRLVLSPAIWNLGKEELSLGERQPRVSTGGRCGACALPDSSCSPTTTTG